MGKRKNTEESVQTQNKRRKGGWERCYQQLPSSGTGATELYLARRILLQQFKFSDPFVFDFRGSQPFNHLLLHQNHIYLTRGSFAEVINFDAYQNYEKDSFHIMSDHKAGITCKRLFSQGEQNVLVTSSYDRSVRLWSKGSCVQCLRGHNGPVLSLSNELLGEDGSKVLASGGKDGTVRLWSLSLSGKNLISVSRAVLWDIWKTQEFLKAEPIAELDGHYGPVTKLYMDPYKIVTGDPDDSYVNVWEVGTGEQKNSLLCCLDEEYVGRLRCHGCIWV